MPNIERPSNARIAKIGARFVASSSATAQKPYPNGVVVWNDSGSTGRGFGYTAKLAVHDGVIVGAYFNEYNRRRAEVIHPVFSHPVTIWEDTERAPWSSTPYVTRTALSKWIAAVKELDPAAIASIQGETPALVHASAYAR